MQTKGCAKIMAVDAPKKIWTGERLDGLEQKVDKGFAQVDKQFEKVDARFEKVEGKIERGINGLRGEMGELGKGLREEMGERFDKVDERFDEARGEMNEVSRYLGKKTDRLTYLLLAAALGYIATHGL